MEHLKVPLEDEDDACLLDALAEEFDAPQQEQITLAAAARDSQNAQQAKIQQLHVHPAGIPHQPPAHIVEHRRAAMAQQGEMLNLRALHAGSRSEVAHAVCSCSCCADFNPA